MKDLVSICIPTYNGEKYLQEALDSVKNQTYKNIEVIISDDESQDKTIEICNNFKREVNFPVHIYTHTPTGIGANWNHCIEKANGNYIQLLFQDDILESNCLEIKLQYIEKYNLKAVCSKRSIIDENNQAVTTGYWYSVCHDLQKLYLHLSFKDFYFLTKKDLKKLLFKDVTTNIFGEPIAFLFEASLFKELGMFNTVSKQILDVEFGYKILTKYPIGLIEQSLFKFRLHSNQASISNLKSKNISSEYYFLKRFLIKEFYHYFSFSFKRKIWKEELDLFYTRVRKKLNSYKTL